MLELRAIELVPSRSTSIARAFCRLSCATVPKVNHSRGSLSDNNAGFCTLYQLSDSMATRTYARTRCARQRATHLSAAVSIRSMSFAASSQASNPRSGLIRERHVPSLETGCWASVTIATCNDGSKKARYDYIMGFEALHDAAQEKPPFFVASPSRSAALSQMHVL